MLTEDNFLNAWIVYWVGSALLLLVTWRIARRWVAWIKYPLLLMLCAVFYVPFNIQADSQAMAPGWLIMLFEGIFVREVGFGRVGPTLAIAMGVALAVFVVVAGCVLLVKRLSGSSDSDQEAAS